MWKNLGKTTSKHTGSWALAAGTEMENVIYVIFYIIWFCEIPDIVVHTAGLPTVL